MRFCPTRAADDGHPCSERLGETETDKHRVGSARARRNQNGNRSRLSAILRPIPLQCIRRR
jgi:hypothetical protein